MGKRAADGPTCPICGGRSPFAAGYVCKLPKDCPAESLWPGQECSGCNEIICTCECEWCGGDRYVEADDPLEEGADLVRCYSCGGTGLNRKRTLW